MASGGLALGIVNYFHTRKADARTVQITTEQRKQEARDLLLQAELALFRIEENYSDTIGSLNASEHTEFKDRIEQIKTKCFNAVERVSHSVEEAKEAREKLQMLDMTPIQAEQMFGQALEIKRRVDDVLSDAIEVYDMVKELEG